MSHWQCEHTMLYVWWCFSARGVTDTLHHQRQMTEIGGTSVITDHRLMQTDPSSNQWLMFIIHNNLPPFKCCSSAWAGAEMASLSFPTKTGRRTKSWGISARHSAQRRLRPATPFRHKKQKMCEHGSFTGNTHGCKQTGHSAVMPSAASPSTTEIIQQTTASPNYIHITSCSENFITQCYDTVDWVTQRDSDAYKRYC